MWNKKNGSSKATVFLRGTKQSRTAVHGFADRCLTTRPWYRLGIAKVDFFFDFPNLNRGFCKKKMYRIVRYIFLRGVNVTIGYYSFSKSTSVKFFSSVAEPAFSV